MNQNWPQFLEERIRQCIRHELRTSNYRDLAPSYGVVHSTLWNFCNGVSIPKLLHFFQQNNVQAVTRYRQEYQALMNANNAQAALLPQVNQPQGLLQADIVQNIEPANQDPADEEHPQGDEHPVNPGDNQPINQGEEHPVNQDDEQQQHVQQGEEHHVNPDDVQQEPVHRGDENPVHQAEEQKHENDNESPLNRSVEQVRMPNLEEAINNPLLVNENEWTRILQFPNEIIDLSVVRNDNCINLTISVKKESGEMMSQSNLKIFCS
jgi:hypothetical protein